MAKVEYRAATALDRAKVRFESIVDGQVAAWSEMEAPELDGVIALLMAKRAELREEVTRELDPGSRMPMILDPVWRTPKDHPEEFRGLALRHPGAGWMMFQFPQHEAREIAKILTK